jgi:hypothetical protein
MSARITDAALYAYLCAYLFHQRYISGWITHTTLPRGV